MIDSGTPTGVPRDTRQMDADDLKATRKLAEDAKQNQSVAPQTPTSLVVQGICLAGARLRAAPVDGDTITVLADGTSLPALDGSVSAGGQVWQRVRMADDREGWIAADLVVTTDPTAAQP